MSQHLSPYTKPLLLFFLIFHINYVSNIYV